MARYKITEAPYRLYKAGVRQYASGVIRCKESGAALFDYYKADSVTSEQKAALLEFCPDIKFMTATPQFAPELKAVAICFPKAAFYRGGDAMKMRTIVPYMGEFIFRNTSRPHALRWSCTGYGAADTLQGMRELIKERKAK